jgi:acyl-coenzyme A synthetase/AMP-(fatty) acid ligase/chorismate-pyruvate lyase
MDRPQASELPHAPELAQFLQLKKSTTYFFEALTGRIANIVVDYQEMVEGNDGKRRLERHARMFCSGLSFPVMYAHCLLELDELTEAELAAILEGKQPLGKILDPNNVGLIAKQQPHFSCSERPEHSTRLGTRLLPSYTLSYRFEVGGRNIGCISETVNEESVSRALADRFLFRSLIHGTLEDPKNAESVLSDPRCEVRYPECVGHLESIQAFISGAGVQAGDCLAVVLSNSVVSALTLLALLDAGYSFVVLPTHWRGVGTTGDGLKIPSFCRWMVELSGAPDAPAGIGDPSSFLKVVQAPEYQAQKGFANRRSARVYLATSGSLGPAKLAVHTYGRLRGNVLRCLERLRLDSSSRIALPVPIYHMYGLAAAFLPGIAGGSSIDLQANANLVKFLERESSFVPNVAFVTPVFCRLLTKGRRQARSYRFIVSAGDRISDATIDASEALHGPLINLYGTTEMGAISIGDRESKTELRARAVGQPLPGVAFRFVDCDSQPPAGAPGPSGELQIQHAYGFEGYVDANGSAIRPPSKFDGDWFCTGDLVAVGPENTLIVQGRVDLSVNRDGLLVALAEVEDRVRSIAEVEEVAVTSHEASSRGAALIAFCVLGEGAELSAVEIRRKCAERMPKFAVPDVVRILEAMPRLSDGKLDRRTLQSFAESEALTL